MSQDLQPNPINWSFGKKFVFRFFCLFFPLYIFFNPNGVLPFTDQLFGIYIEPFHNLIPWIGKHILGLPDITVFTNGSGDTTYDYVTLLLMIVLALSGAIVWTLIDRKRTSYNQLYYWLSAIVRYYAAITMCAYGSFKVWKLQFPEADTWRLMQPYGESSPMGLAWTFMGYSEGYNYFTGIAEILGGVLLFFRKTLTLGAIVTFVVMGNVMAINYCFDIPVKLLSTMLVVMALFLMAKDIQRLVNFFFLNKTAAPSDISRPHIRNKALRISLIVIKSLLLVYTLGMLGYQAASTFGEYGDSAPRPPLYGIYNVETFVRNKDTIEPLQTDTVRWKQLIVSRYRTGIKSMNDSLKTFAFRPDTSNKKIEMFSWKDTTVKNHLVYLYPDKEHLVMQGTWKGDSIYVRMKIYDRSKFLLNSRPFSWVNEYPYNR